MLFYLFFYLLAAVLVFQGTQLLGEQSTPMGVVPAEVAPDRAKAKRWGAFLIGYGVLLAVVGLLSHGNESYAGALAPLRGLGVLVMTLYGLWLLFGRKVDYTPAPVQGGDHGHH